MLNSTTYRPIICWLFTGCILIYLMVIVGGLTRLTNSGLSMVHWSPLGSFPPMNEQAWSIEFSRYKESPEFKHINYQFVLNDFKRIFWLEYIHRFIGRTIGMVFIIPFLFFFFKKSFPFGFSKKMLVLMVLGLSQGLLGWFMVKSGLIDNPHVSHYRLAAHLILAFCVFGFTFWYALDLTYPLGESKNSRELKKIAVLLLTVVGIQIIYGAFVAGLKAGYLFPTFPKMEGSWIPYEAYTYIVPKWRNFVEGQAGVQFIHRCLAYVVVGVLLILFFVAKKTNCSPIQRKVINYLLVVVLIQFFLGVITIVYQVPILIATMHQTGAFVLFGTTLLLIHRS